MKAIKVLLITIWVLALQFSYAQTQSFAVKSYKLTVAGTSNLHDWESSVEKLEGKGSFALANNSFKEISDVVITIPVKSIKSTKGKMMDKKTYEAFNAEKNPSIIFTLTGQKTNEAKNILDASGTLTMAGVTKPIDLTLTYKVLPGGELQITGSKKLTMTDFKMEPPTAMMGTIKVGNEVVVNFEITLSTNNTVQVQK
ncbi:MAG: YceI family protein [Cyclobacteriaceae bacterium]